MSRHGRDRKIDPGSVNQRLTLTIGAGGNEFIYALERNDQRR